jgi:hypothetical protein
VTGPELPPDYCAQCEEYRGGPHLSDADLCARYNYDEFVPEKYKQWLNFEASPRLGEPAPDFPLWDMGARETRLSAIWSQHTYLIVEFGSFT